MSATMITIPKRMKNPPYQSTSNMSHPNTSPMTFAAFWSIFMGHADALESISLRLRVFA